VLISPLKAGPVIVLVTPVWNDSRRFGLFGPELAKALAASGLVVQWVVADDGSCAQEQSKLKLQVEELHRIYEAIELDLSGQRMRKGGAIFRVWDQYPEADWLAFLDGDGAIDADWMVKLIREAIDEDSGICIAAIRKDAEEAPVRRGRIRSIAMRIFALLVRLMVGLQSPDTQCGAKVVPGAAYCEVRGKLKERGFVFDVELLLALEKAGCRIHYMRVGWKEVAGGKVSLLADGWRMIAGLRRIRGRLKRGDY
jgi:hypothetical protein